MSQAETAANLRRTAIANYARQSFADCEAAYAQLIATAPAHATLEDYLQLAKLKAVRQGKTAAQAVMADALRTHPGDTFFVAAYADQLEPADAIALLTQHLAEIGGDPGRRAYVLRRLTLHRAPQIRSQAGHAPDIAQTWDDTYRWPDPEGLAALKHALHAELAAGSRRATAFLDLAHVLIAEGAWDDAEILLAQLRAGGKRTPADFSAFGRAFHEVLDNLSDDDIVRDLPPVEELAAPHRQRDETIFMASDPVYFRRFTLPFARQLDAMDIAVDLHVHLLDGDQTDWADATTHVENLKTVRVRVSAEASNVRAQGMTNARLYYHAVRYIRLYQELARADRPIWVLDADVALTRDPRTVFAALQPADIALRGCPCAFEPMLKFTASCVGFAPTALGIAFARRVAAYIATWKARGTWGWGVDQLALLSAYAHMAQQGAAPKTLFLDAAAMSEKTQSGGAIRFMSGLDKFTSAQKP